MFLVQDKAGLLSEIEQLRYRNQSLEQELRELLNSYEDLQKEEEQQKYQIEKQSIVETELEDLRYREIQEYDRKLHNQMKSEY